MPGTKALPRMWCKLVVAATGLAAVVAACAPAGNPPNIPVKAAAGSVQVAVVDSVNDAGRTPSVAIDPQGQPVVGYQLLLTPPAPGLLPAPVVAGQPQPPSVLVATQRNGVWTRTAVTGGVGFGKAQGTATELGNKKFEAIAGVNTALAVDTQGKDHVIWATPTGVYYSDDTAASFSPKDQVTKRAAVGGSIAVGATGAVWISYYDGSSVKAATKGPSGWTEETVATTSVPPGPAQVTSVRVDQNGDPIVAYGDGGTTRVATRGGGSWSAQSVPGQGGYGASLALGQGGVPTVASYDAAGDVIVAEGIGSGQFQAATVAHTVPGPSGQANPSWGTGLALDGKGTAYLVFADTAKHDVELAVKAGSSWRTRPLEDSTFGASPSIAVDPKGTKLAAAWYDTRNQNLEVAQTSSGGVLLAFSPPPVSLAPAGGPTTAGPACSPSGTTVAVVAPTGAAGSGFEKTCYAAPAGQAFTVDFSNQDSGVPHNFEIFTDSSASTRLGGAKDPTDILTGPGQTTYKVDPLKAGTYYFRCDIHPTTMNGQFVVAGK